MNKSLFYFLLLFVFSNAVYAQQKLIDSSYRYIQYKYYTNKYKNDTTAAKKYADAFLLKAQKAKDTINTALGYTYKSEAYGNDSIYINHLDEMIERTSKRPTKIYPAFFHFRKGHFYSLVSTNKNEALKEILLAKKYAELTNNDSLAYLMYSKVGVLVANNGNRKKAIEIYRECYDYYKSNKEKISKDDFFAFLYNFSTTYSDLSQNDSALYYNRIAYQYSFEQKDTLLTAYAKFKQGEIHYDLKNYQAAIDSIIGATPVLIDDENYLLVSEGYSRIGKAYSELNNLPKALQYFQKVDSMHNSRQIYYNSTSQKEAFKFLYQYYKDQENTKLQLAYLNKIIAWDSIKIASDDQFEETLYDNYEKNNLAERDQLIQELEDDISFSRITKYSLFGVSFVLLLLLSYEYMRRKKLRRRFEELQAANQKVVPKEKPISENISPKLNIPQNLVEQIINGLNAFEKKKGYINSNLSLNSLASDLKTNPNYLSKIINHHLKIGFSSYINELRIEYVLQLLNQNLTVRKYSIKAIANEVGYKNPESFSNAFYKKTGLKPSYYIKQLNKDRKSS